MKNAKPRTILTAADIGRLGGQSKSKRKREAVRENLEKARKKRWKKTA